MSRTNNEQDKHPVGQTPSWTNIEWEKYQVGQTLSGTHIGWVLDEHSERNKE